MRVVIVGKTRRGRGACVGGLTQDGRSVRLVPASGDDAAGLEYKIGEVWEIEALPDPNPIPPHVENVIVHSARRLKRVDNLEAIIRRLMPPLFGGPELLFEGRTQRLPSGGLYISKRGGLPFGSTLFWTPDQPLRIDLDGKRIRYRYPTEEGGRTLTFVGFQEPLEVIPVGALLRVSLAHWWRARDKPDEELRCHAQLSGWILPEPPASSPSLTRCTSAPKAAGERRADLARARQALKETFGYAGFLPLQEEIIARVLQGRDTFAILPTGGGKSLCYQLPALLLEGLTVVVSPLIALMQDQVRQLRELGISAALLNSALTHAEYLAMAHSVRNGQTRLLYVAPETLLRPETLALLRQRSPACLAVDEAHCISEWGHDFRPEYRQVQQARRRFPQAVCLALTASATHRVREDVRRLLAIPADGVFAGSFNRPNLFLAAATRRDGLGQTLAFLERRRGQAGIIYCSTKKQVDQLAAALRGRGWPALPYHAGMDPKARQESQDQFARDDAAIVVATIAFGMGINKPNVRFVLHYNLPKDIESYYQEIGRAGRDGLAADCLLLHSRADALTVRRFIDEGAMPERAGRQARLDAMMRFAETDGCRRGPLLDYFGEAPPAPCGNCDNCRIPPTAALADVTAPARKFLDCVRLTGERFGPAHIIGILRGSRSQRVLECRHDRLSCHGGGIELSQESWRELAQALIGQQIVEQDLQFGGLRLTPKGRAVLQNEKVFVRQKAAAPAPLAAQSGPRDPELFDQLRRKRRELADQAGLPAYLIFSDRALLEMAARRPRTPSEFLAISGVGRAKLANYGGPFLEVIRAYLG